jgi:signal transduction histidine kinase
MGTDARRMVVTADTERRRLERMLHDGAQQRLAAVTTTLALAQRRLAAGEDGALELVQEASDEAQRCLEDLRDLAREIYPAVLAERGLGGAFGDLARRAPGFVEIRAAPAERLPEPVEIAAYLVASEALARLPEDGEATLSAEIRHRELWVDVRGGTLDAEALERLGDRITALDGRIEEATAGQGFVRAVIPLEAPASDNGGR